MKFNLKWRKHLNLKGSYSSTYIISVQERPRKKLQYGGLYFYIRNSDLQGGLHLHVLSSCCWCCEDVLWGERGRWCGSISVLLRTLEKVTAPQVITTQVLISQRDSKTFLHQQNHFVRLLSPLPPRLCVVGSIGEYLILDDAVVLKLTLDWFLIHCQGFHLHSRQGQDFF